MHQVSDEINVVDRRVVESPEMLGKECIGCFRVLAYGFYKRDASYRDGHRDLCLSCEQAPRMSTDEHVHRLKEQNYNSEAVKKQRWEHQEEDELANDRSRIGHPMHHTELLDKLRRLIPDLFVIDGRFQGDLAAYRIYGQPQPRLEGRTFEYLFYIPTGILPEFSAYEFDARDVPIREKLRGWRTVLLRLIKARMVSEDDINRVFGRADGPAASRYNRELWKFRNNK